MRQVDALTVYETLQGNKQVSKTYKENKNRNLIFLPPCFKV